MSGEREMVSVPREWAYALLAEHKAAMALGDLSYPLGTDHWYWVCRRADAEKLHTEIMAIARSESPRPCDHEKIYDSAVIATLPAQHRWICRKCGAEGVDVDPMPVDLGEYDRLKREKREREGE